ncbi:hypothetical protein ES706_06735 [subsurface metagenome]
MDISNVLTDEARQRGFTLVEPDDHVVVLLRHGKVIAKSNQGGITIDNVIDYTGYDEHISKN